IVNSISFFRRGRRRLPETLRPSLIIRLAPTIPGDSSNSTSGSRDTTLVNRLATPTETLKNSCLYQTQLICPRGETIRVRATCYYHLPIRFSLEMLQIHGSYPCAVDIAAQFTKLPQPTRKP